MLYFPTPTHTHVFGNHRNGYVQLNTAVRGSCDGRTAGMFSEATTVEPWDGVGKAVMTGTHMVQKGASGGVRCSH
jgi:hypothetical protein